MLMKLNKREILTLKPRKLETAQIHFTGQTTVLST